MPWTFLREMLLEYNKLLFFPTSLLLILLFVVFLLFFIHQEKQLHSKKRPVKHRTRYLVGHIFIGCLTAYCLLYSLIAINTFVIAYQHGYREYFKPSFDEIVESIEHSPVESKLPKNKDKCIVIYYRFGCNDCELIYHSLSERLTDTKNVYWVATRSKQGEYLRKEYPVSDVPSGLYIRNDETKDGYLYTLSVKTEQNSYNYISVDGTNLNKLLAWQSDHLNGTEE